jgi:ribosomal-protein-alanine N-acetyltransferase
VKVADEAELANLAVDPSRRGTGVGAALLQAFLERVEAEPPLPAVYLEVRASNAAAQRLYARAGFVPAGVRRDYYERPREDALVLRRPPGPVGG